MVKPLIVFDFDGVFNPLNRHLSWIGEGSPTEIDHIYPTTDKWEVVEDAISNETHFTPDNEEKVSFEGKSLFIRWSSELVTNVNEVIDSGQADFLWLTTWKGATDTVLNPTLGLHVGSGQFLPPNHRSGNRYFVTSYDYYQVGKWLVLQDYFATLPVEERPPLVWFEDVATTYMNNFDEPELTQVSDELQVPSLVFKTDSNTGISRKEWAAAVSWLEQFN